MLAIENWKRIAHGKNQRKSCLELGLLYSEEFVCHDMFSFYTCDQDQKMKKKIGKRKIKAFTFQHIENRFLDMLMYRKNVIINEKNHFWCIFFGMYFFAWNILLFSFEIACSTNFPAGNLVDGVPPALSFFVHETRK